MSSTMLSTKKTQVRPGQNQILNLLFTPLDSLIIESYKIKMYIPYNEAARNLKDHCWSVDLTEGATALNDFL